MLYQRKNLADGASIGEPGPLPDAFGTGLTDAILADISAGLGEPCATEMGYSGQGFFPLTRKVSALEFKLRHTQAERIAIRAAAEIDPGINDYLDILNTTDVVELDFQGTIDGIAYLAFNNLLTPERAAAIRA